MTLIYTIRELIKVNYKTVKLPAEFLEEVKQSATEEFRSVLSSYYTGLPWARKLPSLILRMKMIQSLVN